MLRILAFLLLLPALASARTFTNADGKELKAEIVAADDSQVALRRHSDQRDFKLPLDRLSESDRAYIAAWRRQLDHPLGWRRLRLHGDGHTVVGTCLPIYGSLNSPEPSRTQSNASLELTLPLGAWVLVGLNLEGARVEGLVQYDGAPDWHLSASNNVLSIRCAPKGSTQRAVAQGSRENLDRPFAQAQEDALRAGASLTATANGREPLIFPRNNFLAANLHVGAADWSKLPSSLRALQLTSRDPIDLDGIERFFELESLALDAPGLRGIEHLAALPKLRALYLKSKSIDPAEHLHLGKLVALRHLNFNDGEHNLPGSGKYDFLASHTNLESLSLSYGLGNVASLDPTLIRNCPNLTRLDFIPRGPEKDDYLRRLLLLTDLSFASITPENALTLMQSGHFQHLHTIRDASFKHPLTMLPKLRSLRLGSSSWPKDSPLWDELPFLDRLHLRSPSEEVLTSIATHPSFKSVQHLSLEPKSAQNLAPLGQLPSLRFLRIESHPSLGALDLAPFPALEALEVHRSEFSSIPTLQNLRALTLDSASIENLGDGAPTKLQTLEIVGSGLANFDGIKDSPALTALLLADCRNLASLSTLADPRKLDSLYISDCNELPASKSAPQATRSGRPE